MFGYTTKLSLDPPRTCEAANILIRTGHAVLCRIRRSNLQLRYSCESKASLERSSVPHVEKVFMVVIMDPPRDGAAKRLHKQERHPFCRQFDVHVLLGAQENNSMAKSCFVLHYGKCAPIPRRTQTQASLILGISFPDFRPAEEQRI
jgi:hypothetical protein